MNTYKILVGQEGRPEAVKQGWSWPAFFFVGMWALYKRLWAVFGVAILFALISYAILAAMSLSPQTTNIVWTVLSMSIWVAFGISGNSWRVNKLATLGYSHKDTFSANTPKAAIAIWEEDGCPDRDLQLDNPIVSLKGMPKMGSNWRAPKVFTGRGRPVGGAPIPTLA